METTEADTRAIFCAVIEGRITVSQFRNWILAIGLPPVPQDQFKVSIALLIGARNQLDFWIDGASDAATCESLRQVLAVADGASRNELCDPLLPYKR